MDIQHPLALFLGGIKDLDTFERKLLYNMEGLFAQASNIGNAAAFTKTQQSDHEALMLQHKNEIVSDCAMVLYKMHQMTDFLLLDKTKYQVSPYIPAVTPTEKERQRECNGKYWMSQNYAQSDLTSGIKIPADAPILASMIHRMIKYLKEDLEKAVDKYDTYRVCPTEQEQATILNLERGLSRFLAMLMHEVEELWTMTTLEHKKTVTSTEPYAVSTYLDKYKRGDYSGGQSPKMFDKENLSTNNK
jgi:hypothetical protein